MPGICTSLASGCDKQYSFLDVYPVIHSATTHCINRCSPLKTVVSHLVCQLGTVGENDHLSPLNSFPSRTHAGRVMHCYMIWSLLTLIIGTDSCCFSGRQCLSGMPLQTLLPRDSGRCFKGDFQAREDRGSGLQLQAETQQQTGTKWTWKHGMS